MSEKNASEQDKTGLVAAASKLDDLQRQLDKAGPSLNLYLALAQTQVELGDLDAASAWFSKAVTLAPDDEGARLGLSKVLRGLGRPAAAEETLRAGLTVAPNSRALVFALGEILLSFQRLEDSLALFEGAFRAQPEILEYAISAAEIALELRDAILARRYLMETLSDIGVHDVVTPLRARLERRDGQFDQALRQAEAALAENPSNAAAAFEAIAALFEGGHLAQGALRLDHYESQGLIEDVGRVQVLRILLAQGQFPLATAYFRTKVFSRLNQIAPALLDFFEQIAAQLISVEPDDAFLAWLEDRASLPGARFDLKVELAELLLIRALPDRSLRMAQSAVTQGSDNPAAWACQAAAQCALGDLDAASESAQTALVRDPNHEKALMTQAYVALYRGQADQAVQFADLAVTVSSEPSHAISMRGELKLRLGRFADGWADFALRSPELWMAPKRQLPNPQAKSLEDCVGKRIFVWAEWGLGEQIMLAPLAGQLAQSGAQVILECQPRLRAVLAQSFPELDVRAEQGPKTIASHEFDLHVRLSDLGAWFRAGETGFPKHGGYLLPSSTKTDTAKQLIEEAAPHRLGKRIGISWASTGIEAPLKSLPSELFTGLAVDGKSVLFNLQHAAARAQASQNRDALISIDDPEMHPDGDVEGLAALISQLDHVVTVSNTVAHVAGALGKPCDVLVPKYRRSLWHWLDHRSDSPWYPSVTVHFFTSSDHAAQTLKAIASTGFST